MLTPSLALLLLLSRAWAFTHATARSTTARRASPQEDSNLASEVVVMVNGLPGSMGVAVAEACARRGMEVAGVALSSKASSGKTTTVAEKVVEFAGPDDADAAARSLRDACAARGKVLVAVDYTVPDACTGNAELYARHDIPFVMGTTGGDVERMEAAVSARPKLLALVAPNMAKQIVAVQAAIANAARDFPGAFAGYDLSVVESHQATKKDTSGTAKAVVASLVDLIDADYDTDAAIQAIERVRDEPTQLSGAGDRLQRVPTSALAGHAYHTYALQSPAGDVRFELRHNVNGRSVYAEGTADAVLFLARRLLLDDDDTADRKKRIFNMIDVLQSGELY